MAFIMHYQRFSWEALDHRIMLWSLLGVSILFYSLVLIYRLSLHPLAKYPGRFQDKLSIYPLIRDCIRGDRHLQVKKLHDKYGSIVRVGPNMLSFNTSTAMHTIYGNAKANVLKSNWYKTLDAGSGDFSTQTVIDKKEHAFRRRVILPAFSDRALRDAETYIDANVRKLMQKLGDGAAKDGWTEPKNFAAWSTAFAFDFISDLGFGSSFNLLDGENTYLPGMMMGTSKFVYYAGYLPFASILNKLLAAKAMDYFPDKAAHDTMQFFNLSEAKLKQREALEEEFNRSSSTPPRRDIFHYLLNSRDPETGKGLTKTQLHADSGLLIAAGSDGVAMILSSALFYLLSNPSTLEALTAEVRSNFNHVDDISMPKLGTLQYLQAVIDETMRMTPPLPSALPRRVLRGGLTVDGVHVPEGIDVGVPAYAIHHNELYFPSSYSFSPERWLVRDGDETRSEGLARARKAFVPFSLGPFNCIGRPVAYLACKLSLAKLVYMYNMKRAGEKLVGEMENRPAEYAMIDWLVGYRDGPVVHFKPRQDAWS